MAALIPSARDTITVGGVVFVKLTNLIELNTYAAGVARTGFRKGAASAGYQVTTGKNLRLRALQVNVTVATADYIENIFYQASDNGYNANNALSSPTYYPAATTGQRFVGYSAAIQTIERAIDFTLPSAQYSGIVQQGTGTVFVSAYGYES